MKKTIIASLLILISGCTAPELTSSDGNQAIPEGNANELLASVDLGNCKHYSTIAFPPLELYKNIEHPDYPFFEYPGNLIGLRIETLECLREPGEQHGFRLSLALAVVEPTNQ